MTRPSSVPAVRRVRRAAVWAVSGAAMLMACSSPSESEPATPAMVEQGSGLYEASCASCHGSDLLGTDQGPPHLSSVYEPGHHSDDSFRAAIAVGVGQHHWGFGPMPPVEGLTEEEVDAIIAFVRSEQETRGFID